MKDTIKIARSLDLSREDDVRSAAKDGHVNLRKHKNKEPCPNCEGKYDEVYQYVEEYRDEAKLYAYDNRWFCLCGWTEVPSKDSTLEYWRTAGVLTE